MPVLLAVCAPRLLATQAGAASVRDGQSQREGQVAWRGGGETLTTCDATEIRAVLQYAVQQDRRHVLVLLDGPASAARRAEFADAGLTLLAYLGADTYFASVAAGGGVETLHNLGEVRAVGAIRRDWKLHPLLADGETPSWAFVTRTKPADEESLVATCVLFHADVYLAGEAERVVWHHRARIRSRLRSVNGLVIELPRGQISALADEDAVQWIEPPLPRLTELNDSNRALTGAAIAQDPPYELNGSGVTVLVFDGKAAFPTHPDFGGRLTVRDASGNSNHATHVAGTIGGDGLASGGLYRGMAPAVTLESYGFEMDGGLQWGFLYTDPGDIERDYAEAITLYGADISNNSIGTNTASNGFPCEWEGDYGLTGMVIDGIVRGSLTGAPFRVVWAAGNERSSGRCGTTYHTTAPPACAKNHITVGAVNSNDDTMTAFSSWGPTDDGRIKPDVCGPGCQSDEDEGVTSCKGDGTYMTACGTSMSAPTVCGLGALLLQDYRRQYPGQPDFRNATLKALLAQTAVDLGHPGPDYKFGYGSVRVAREDGFRGALDVLRSGDFVEGELDQGDVWAFTVVVNPGDWELRATLAWDDEPGTPNVDPVLVNDLDLRVFDSANTQYFPWTLNPAEPAAAAVRTQPDQVNNIEQVVVDAPPPGAYRVEVHGYSVPKGPQPFSLCAGPQLLRCSAQGRISLDRPAYACGALATIQVVDCDLNVDGGVVETVRVTLTSTAEPGGERVTLEETGTDTAIFRGVLPLETVDEVGVLLIADGDVLVATYIDADDGQGGLDVEVTETAGVDCNAPLVTGVQAAQVAPGRATITFETDEPTHATVWYGPSCGAPDDAVAGPGMRTYHRIELHGLSHDTVYYFAVAVEDSAGNATLDDNGGACYTFATPRVRDYFSEEFVADNDLDFRALLLTPDGSPAYYAACTVAIGLLPTDPAGGEVLPLADDDSAAITLAGGALVSLYGTSYDTIYVGSNGYLTFGAGDVDPSESFAEHFALPRVAALYDDLDPGARGTVSWHQTDDRVAVTWHTVPEYDEFATNTFQIELFFDGRIQISWLDIAAADGLAGLSDGGGLADDFLESDLSAVVSCGPRPPMAADGTASTPINTPLVVALFGVDDGEPYPPGALDYIITGLPTYDLRDVGDGHLITTDDLPYTLVDGGQAVLYAPGLDFVGQDLFEFKANDGGTPPDGGDSNVATVTVQVEPVLALPFFDDFAAVTFDAGQWGRVFHATIDDVGIDPPSPPYAARLNGDPSGGDELWTQRIDLSGETGVLLAYAWQRTGGGNPPEPGDDLIVEYLDEDGAWQLLRQHPGLGDDMTTFELAETFLPPAAFHPVFRLRFRKSQGNAGAFDDWFVDDVLLMSSDAPVAHADEVAVPPNMTTLMTLTASDPNGDPLGFVIEVLPQHGRLDDPVAGPIVAVPHVLADGGAVVEYTPFRNHVGADLLGFSVSDGTHNSGTAAVAISVGGRQRIYAFGLDMDPGWTVAGGWQFGQPQGGGSFAGDPTGGFTDAFVYGYNLAGDYPDNLPATEYLTTTPLDFTGLSTVELRFRRWLGIEAANWDQAHIQVSADDVTWNTVWEHFGAAISESAWSLQVCDLCDVGGAPAVRVRWGLGPTDQSTTYPGWNIDDVEIWALPDGPQLGDMNCDGRLDVFDIDVFIVVLKDVEPYDVYYAAHPACNHRAADCNEDGVVNAFDIDAFVALLLGG